ncbi:MAG: lamin tail domain-containing protein, partial [Acidobacteriota bacterium]
MYSSIKSSAIGLSFLFLCGVAVLFCPATVQAQAANPGDIVISQVYGGGGNPGSTYQNNFIELFNRSSATIDISGWPLHFASASGSFNVPVPLTSTRSVSIAPGRYLLIQLGPSSSNGAPLPFPDLFIPIDAANIATSGKLAFTKPGINLVGTCPLPNANVIDFVGW